MNGVGSLCATRRTVLAAGIAGFGATGLSLGGAFGQTTEIIDIHAHLIADDLARYPPTPLDGQGSDWSKERHMPAERLIAEMDAAGVSKAACVQVSTFYGVNNSYLVDSIAKYPKRLTGVASIDVLAPNAVSILEGLTKQGVSGLRIFTGGGDTAKLVDPKSFPVWEFAQTKKLAICVQTGGAGLANLGMLLRRFPKTPVILDHITQANLESGPPYAAALPIFELAAFSNLHCKISPRTIELARKGSSTPEAFFAALVKAFGAGRIAFGSNIPSDAPPLKRTIDDVLTCLAGLSPWDRAMVLAGTAKRLYPALAYSTG
jgi:predicted TIM-barrel fold metal-dependent hydrolase